MSPIQPDLATRDSSFNPGLPSEAFKAQWKHPSDVFSVLLLVGGDVVAAATAQLAGGWITPVAFSFGKLDHCK